MQLVSPESLWTKEQYGRMIYLIYLYLRGEARRGIASNNIKTSRCFPSLEMEQKRRV